MELFIREGRRYKPAPAHVVKEAAASYVRASFRGVTLTSPKLARSYLQDLLGGREAEMFTVVLLDNRHRVIDTVELFHGTIDGASVHPREVVRLVIDRNAAAVLLAHNHPSGVADPSQADELITQRLRDALAMIDVRVLDHVIVTRETTVSFAERGLL